MLSHIRHGRGIGRLTTTGVVLALALVSGACDSLLEVELPGFVSQETLDDVGNVDLLVASAVGDFECAFSEYIVAGALIGNEMADGQLAARMWDYDRRTFTENGGPFASFTCSDSDPGVYQTLSTARFSADNAEAVLEEAGAEAVAGRDEMLATAAAYSGYSHLLLGEGMCSAAIDAGPELSSQQMFALAEEKFTSVIQNQAAPADIRNMALVGRARARLNQNKGAEAAADARQVPEGFVKYANYSAASFRSSNRIWTMNNRDERVAIENDFWNVQWKGVDDPRVDVMDTGRLAAADDLTPLWVQRKYPNQDSRIPIARYAEAQLIIAEVEGGQTAVDIINELHAAAGIPPYDPATDGPIADQVALERQRELFLESHHLYDKIRLELPLLPPAGTPFQESGSKGGFYGNTTCLPLPLVEKLNNPNIGT
jgi:hypothetical protein